MKEKQDPINVLDAILTFIVVSGFIYLGSHAYYVLALRRIGVYDDGFVMANYHAVRLRWSLEQGEGLQSSLVNLYIGLAIVVISCIAAGLFKLLKPADSRQELYSFWWYCSLVITGVILLLMWAVYLIKIAHSRFTTLDMVDERALYDSWIMLFVLLLPLMMFAAGAWAKDVGILLPSMGLWLFIGFAGYWYWQATIPGA